MVKLNIKGSSFAAQYRRTTGRAIDSTDNWESKEEADRYAQNLEEEAYFPYDGQIITVKESGKTNLYTLVVDESITIQDGRNTLNWNRSPLNLMLMTDIFKKASRIH